MVLPDELYYAGKCYSFKLGQGEHSLADECS